MKTSFDVLTINTRANGVEQAISQLNTSDAKAVNGADNVVLTEQIRDKFTSASADYASTQALLKQQLEQEFSNSIQLSSPPMTVQKGYNAKAEELALHFVTSNYQQGLQRGKNTDELTELINLSSQNVRSAYSKTSSILEALGQFGPEQKSFISKSETRVERALTSFSEDRYRRDRADSAHSLSC